MRIVLFGKDGQVGARLVDKLAHYPDAVFLGRDAIDLSHPKEIQGVLNDYSPDVIINAAAYTQVDLAESHQELAFKVNSEAPAQMAEYAFHRKVLLCHYSTDYVFDGQKTAAYQEQDTPYPLNIYGQSKLEGENRIVASGCPYYIFRTSWVYSHVGKNFIGAILNAVKKYETIKVVNDQIGAPTSADFIAQMTLEAIKQEIPSGIYHLNNSGYTSWYEYAKYFIRRWDSENLRKLIPVSSKEYPFVAKRPQNSRLDNQLLSTALNCEFLEWQEELERVFHQYPLFEKS
jgi:dTDP-4-dehydrorhamnose reductase